MKDRQVIGRQPAQTHTSDIPSYSLTGERHDYAVIIPCYNASQTIERALQSIARQTLSPKEIIVVDDGSSDVELTAKIVEKYERLVRLIRQENAGPAAARNHGARYTNSTWLAFLDADDSWVEAKMQQQLDLIDVHGAGVIFERDEADGSGFIGEPSFDDLWQRNWIRTSGAVVHREAFLSVGGFDEDPALIGAEDYNLWLRLLAQGWNAIAHSDSLIDYTPAANSITQQIGRAARGELYNVEKVGRELGIHPARIARKSREIRVAFGRDLIHSRDLLGARKMLAEPVRHFMPRAIFLWLITLMPVRLLDGVRRLRSNR